MSFVNRLMFPGTKPSNTKIPFQIVKDRYPVLTILNPNALFTVLYFYGNKGSMVDTCRLYRSLPSIPINLICPEYSGYDKRFLDSQETEKSACTMANIMYEYSKRFKKRIIVVGYSIGTGIAASLYDKDIYGMVLLNAYESIRSIALDHNAFFGRMFRNRFLTLEKLKNYKGRLILIAGEKDDTIPFTNSIRIYDHCPSKHKRLILHKNSNHHFRDYFKLVVLPIVQTWF